MEWLNKAISLIKTLPSKISEPITQAGVVAVIIGLVLAASVNFPLGIIISIAGIIAIVVREFNSKK